MYPPIPKADYDIKNLHKVRTMQLEPLIPEALTNNIWTQYTRTVVGPRFRTEAQCWNLTINVLASIEILNMGPGEYKDSVHYILRSTLHTLTQEDDFYSSKPLAEVQAHAIANFMNFLDLWKQRTEAALTEARGNINAPNLIWDSEHCHLINTSV